MRLLSYARHGRQGWGSLRGETVTDHSARFPSLRAWIEAGQPALPDGGETVPLAELELLPVIPDPGKILCVGLNYEEHRKETGRPVSGHPAIFTRFADTQVGHGQPVLRPRSSERFDWEGELAVIIGKPGRHIPKTQAMEHVAGFACYNDVSVRDWQRHTHQFIPGKNFPATGPFGPCLVTPDEVPDLPNAVLETRVNGEVVQHTTIAHMIFDVPSCIEYISGFTTLRPGDVIATGTPGGVGDRRDPPRYLKPGDTVEVEIAGIGLLRNPVGLEA